MVRHGQRYIGRSRRGQRKCLRITENLFRVHAQCHCRRKDGRFGTKQVGEESHETDLPPHTHIGFPWYSPVVLLLQRAWATKIHPKSNLIHLSNSQSHLPQSHTSCFTTAETIPWHFCYFLFSHFPCLSHPPIHTTLLCTTVTNTTS